MHIFNRELQRRAAPYPAKEGNCRKADLLRRQAAISCENASRGNMAEEKNPGKGYRYRTLTCLSGTCSQAMRGLGLPAKTTAGSLSPEDAEKAARSFRVPQGREALEKSAGQPNVIVPQAADQPAGNSQMQRLVRRGQNPLPKQVKQSRKKPARSQSGHRQNDAAKIPQPRAEQEAKPREPRAQKSRKSQKPIATPGARIISRPG